MPDALGDTAEESVSGSFQRMVRDEGSIPIICTSTFSKPAGPFAAISAIVCEPSAARAALQSARLAPLEWPPNRWLLPGYIARLA